MLKSAWEIIKNIGGFAMIFAILFIGYFWVFGIDNIPRGPIEPATFDAEPFTLSCDTTYTLNGNVSYIDFKATIEPRSGSYYQFDWRGNSLRADGKYEFNSRHFDMTGEIRIITRADESVLRIGDATINRDTGKYEFSSVVSGTCSVIEYVPIPRASF